MVELNVKEYLSAEDINNHGTEALFTDSGVIRTKAETGFDNDTFEIGIKFKTGEERIWSMNLTSQKAFIASFGKNTESWIAKGIKFTLAPVVINGQKKSAIYGEPTPPIGQ